MDVNVEEAIEQLRNLLGSNRKRIRVGSRSTRRKIRKRNNDRRSHSRHGWTMNVGGGRIRGQTENGQGRTSAAARRTDRGAAGRRAPVQGGDEAVREAADAGTRTDDAQHALASRRGRAIGQREGNRD